ncbi:site-specific integrase [Methylobacterium flocculans]|uniref:hypothetical protein n=1 Tax=Methylobacterium flocculans TaxID=2984843 RepID=UPI0021F2B1C5|nr:hypothetical protein [Methylobacterium sp. FF17]
MQFSLYIKAVDRETLLNPISFAYVVGIVPLRTKAKAYHRLARPIRSRIGTAPNRKTAATAEVASAVLMRKPDTLTGKRDRALLALGFSGAFRRSELIALDVSDLREYKDGLRRS